ncbi:hypothetical protein [Nocardia rhamnosiphila]
MNNEIPKKVLARWANGLESLTRQGSEHLADGVKGAARFVERDAEAKERADRTPLDARTVDRPDRPAEHQGIRRQTVDHGEGTPHSLRGLLAGESTDLKKAFRWMGQGSDLPFRWKLEDATLAATKFRGRSGIMVVGAIFDGRRRIGHSHTAFSMSGNGKITAHVRELKIYDHFDDKEYRGKGFLRAFDRVLDDPRLSEIDEILVYGQLPNGGLPWVGVGYDWHRGHGAFASSVATMADTVRGMLDRASTPGDRAMLSGLLTELAGAPADIRSAREIYAMTDSRGAPIGHELLRNTPFPGIREPRSTGPSPADHTVLNAEDRTGNSVDTGPGTNYWDQPGYEYDYPSDESLSPVVAPTEHARENSTEGPSLGEIINPRNSSGQ